MTFTQSTRPTVTLHLMTLVKQLPIAIDWIAQMGFANLMREGYEADDVITTVTKFAKAERTQSSHSLSRQRFVSDDRRW